jgi:hypothetical protein
MYLMKPARKVVSLPSRLQDTQTNLFSLFSLLPPILDRMLLSTLRTTPHIQHDSHIHLTLRAQMSVTPGIHSDAWIFPDPTSTRSSILDKGTITLRRLLFLQSINQRHANALQ